jgi:hypothetical protein
MIAHALRQVKERADGIEEDGLDHNLKKTSNAQRSTSNAQLAEVLFTTWINRRYDVYSEDAAGRTR